MSEILDSAEAYFSRGVLHVENGNYDEAIVDFTKSIELNQNNPDVYNHRGNAHYDKEDFESAAADYSAAIEVDPNYVKAYSNRGYVYVLLGREEDAIYDFN